MQNKKTLYLTTEFSQLFVHLFECRVETILFYYNSRLGFTVYNLYLNTIAQLTTLPLVNTDNELNTISEQEYLNIFDLFGNHIHTIVT